MSLMITPTKTPKEPPYLNLEIGDEEIIFTKINRFFEKIILKKLNKRGIYEEGKYYE